MGILVGRLTMTQGGSLRKCHGPVVVHTSEGSPSPMSFRLGTTSSYVFLVSSFEAVHCAGNLSVGWELCSSSLQPVCEKKFRLTSSLAA